MVSLGYLFSNEKERIKTDNHDWSIKKESEEKKIIKCRKCNAFMTLTCKGDEFVLSWDPVECKEE